MTKKILLIIALWLLFIPSAHSVNVYSQAAIAYKNSPIVIDVLSSARGVLPSTLTISQQLRAGVFERNEQNVYVFTPYPESHPGNSGSQIEAVGGKVVFQPAPGYSGSYKFNFQAGDGNGNTDQSFYLVHVQPLNERAEITAPLEEHIFGASYGRSWVPQVNDPDNSEIKTVTGSHQSRGVIRYVSLNTYYGPHNLTLVTDARGTEKAFSLVTTEGDSAPNVATTLINVYGGRVKDKAISQTLPAISQSYQAQTFEYYLSQNNPYAQESYNSTLTIELEGDFSLGDLPETCESVDAAEFTGKILTCNVNVAHDATVQVDIQLTTGASGLIISRASLPIASDEIRHFDNTSEKSLPVVDLIVATSGNSQTGFIPGATLLLDINNDDLDDLLVAPASFGKPRWYLNNGNGGFTASDFLFAPIKAQTIVQGNIDGDSNPDIVLVGRFGEFQQYEKLGERLVLQAARHQWSRSQAHVTSAIITDLNNDQNGELYVTGDTFYARYKNDGGLLKTPTDNDWFSSSVSGFSLATGQLNNNIFNELIADNLNGNIQLFNNPGNGNANSLDTSNLISNENKFFQTLLIDDVDKNNFDDVILIARSDKNSQNPNLQITDLLIERRTIERNNQIKLLSNNDFSLTPQDSLLVPSLHRVIPLDLDNDQDNELLLHTSNGAIILLENNQGTYQRVNYGVASSADNQLLVGQLTNDLTPDLLIVQPDGTIKTLLITEPLSIPTPTPPEIPQVESTPDNGGGSTSRLAILLFLLIGLIAIVKFKAKKSPS